MHPDYEKKLREIEEWERKRTEQEAHEREAVSAKTPNLEKIPLGCVMWIAALSIGIFYAFRGCAGVV